MSHWSLWDSRCDFSELQHKTINNIEISNGNTEVKFYCNDGSEYLMYHSQDCCESVELEEIIGDLNDLINSEILLAEVVTNEDENPEDVKVPKYQESFTWTFYKLRTNKGSVTLRWYGESNGYYSESVDFSKIK